MNEFSLWEGGNSDQLIKRVISSKGEFTLSSVAVRTVEMIKVLYASFFLVFPS